MSFQTLCQFPWPSREWLTKTARVAKIFSIIMLAGCLQLSASGYSQNVTLSKSNVSLVTVFQEMQKQTGFNFLYTYEDLERAGNINVDLRNIPIWEAVAACLRGKPLTFSIVDRTVVIKYYAPVIRETDAPPALPTITVRGHVADSTGAPLSGATVMIKGTTKGTKTNVKGDFEMKEIPSNAVLVISFTGYADKEIIPNTEMSMYIVLKPSLDILDATVIQAYGTTSRRFNIGSIATVDAATISKQPVTNVLLALQGQATGLAINAMNGVPGSKVLVQVRGQNTLLSDPSNGSAFKPYDQPLFLVDGVPFAPQNVNITQLSTLANPQSFSGGINQNGGLSPFNGINPADIESISILKDADATSIYGTQGSNGVILITTRKGKPGKAVFNLNINTGFNTNARKIKFMNTQQYLQMRKDAFAADGLTPSSDPYDPGYAPELTLFDQNKYTDWPKLIFGKTSTNTDVHASLSGGSYTDVFMISAGYTRSNFNFPGDFNDQRLSLHTNMRHTSADNHLTVEFGTDYSYTRNYTTGFPGAQRIISPPNTPDLLDSAGGLIWSYKGYDMTQLQFYANLLKPMWVQGYNLNSTLRIGYKIFSSLNFSLNMGYSRFTSYDHSENPAKSQGPSYVNTSAEFNSSIYQTVNVEPQLDYSNRLGRGMLSVLAGATYKKSLSDRNSLTGYNYANDNLMGSINGAASTYTWQEMSLYKYAAAFARIKYIYDQKYILSLAGRRDGSSNFGPGNQFGSFGSAGAGWIFSEEKPFKSLKPVWSFGKLSGSYGTTGSDGIAPYRYQPLWTAGYSSTPPFQGVVPNFPQNLYNPNYSWALKKSLNIAMDLGFFHDRVLLNATWYREREGNQLSAYPLPGHVGFPSVIQNVKAVIQNSGWEFSLNSTNIKGKDLTWTTNFNISFNRNKLVDFPNLQYSTYKNQYVIGKPVSTVIGYKYKGIDPATGLFEFYTKDSHVTTNPDYRTVDEGGDRMPIANREVKFMGGLGNTLTYKNLSLYLFFQFSSQMAPSWLYTLYSSNQLGLSLNNQPVEALNYWKHPGDQTQIGKLTTNYGSATYQSSSGFSGSSGAYVNDTYLRLKTVSLSYSVPESLLKKWHMKECRAFVNAQNLLTFTNYKVSDPEQFNEFVTFPIQRIIAAGLSFNF